MPYNPQNNIATMSRVSSFPSYTPNYNSTLPMYGRTSMVNTPNTYTNYGAPMQQPYGQRYSAYSGYGQAPRR